MKKIVIAINAVVLIFASAAMSQDNQWDAVTGTDNLREFMTGLKAERTLPNGELSKKSKTGDVVKFLRI